MGKGPFLPNVEEMLALGFDPKTKLPLKFSTSDGEGLRDSFRIFLRVQDEQTAVNRYKWYNLPANISSQELERLLYYRGRLAIFYFQETNDFYFMPFASDGSIDFYGRLNSIYPVPIVYGDDKSEAYKKKVEMFKDRKYKVVKDVKTDIVTLDDFVKSTVILEDYTPQISQSLIPRATLNEPIINVMSEILPLMRTSLIIGTGVKAMRVNDGTQEANALFASSMIYNAAIKGHPFVPFTSPFNVQDIVNNTGTKPNDYLLALQSLDNLRLSSFGLENGGLFQKKAHVNDMENAVNGGNIGLINEDGSKRRQRFCNIVNSIWGLGIWCEPAETAAEVDLNGDGIEYDVEDSSSQVGGENNENASI